MTIGYILVVALGIGFVIFFHELGHFLLAKWNGVKVEKFSVGFGPALLRFRRGETEYALSAFPLGGYVKMLGETPDEGIEAATDPRSYHNKSVGARMAIISAGVIMNVILGFFCFLFAYSWGGLLETVARFGLVVAGLPAYEVGIHTGDQAVAIDGQREDVSFDVLLQTVALSGHGQVVDLELKRRGLTEPVKVSVVPRREVKQEKPSIGVNSAYGLKIDEDGALLPPGMPTEADAALKSFKGGDRIVQVGLVGQPLEAVPDYFELVRIMARHADKPLRFAVQRGSDGNARTNPAGQTVEITVPPHRFVDFGFRLAIEPISAIQGGSIAEKAGFKKGDLIRKVDGDADFDPMYLPTYCQQHAGQSVEFEVERRAADGTLETTTMNVTPDDTPAYAEAVMSVEPQEIPGLGLAYPINMRIVAVREGSPAAKAGLKPGQSIQKLTMYLPVEKKKDKPLEFTFENQEDGWPQVFNLLQDPAEMPFLQPPRQEVEITIAGVQKPIRITPEPREDWYHPLRGLRFETLQFPLPPMSLPRSLERASHETVDKALAVYYMLRGLRQGRLSGKNIGGPIRIARMAYYFASSGASPFIYFLGLLSVNLAVLNFLPIPPLDGGQMAFLIAEKVRGRPLPESALVVGTYAGLLLVLSLMVFFVWQDVVLTFFS